MEYIEGGVTAAKGFSAAAVAAHVKYEGRTDMAMVFSQVPCALAGTFTTNVVKAAPVKWDARLVHEGGIGQAVVINSGIANACTGQEGMDICKAEAEAAAKALSIAPDHVLVASTGEIGRQLPVDRMVKGIEMLAPLLEESLEAGGRAAKAIMTTDTQLKSCCRLLSA